MTEISVIIPVRNGGATLGGQLDALIAASRSGVDFEVIIADNGSTDSTVTIATSYRNRLRIRVADCSRGPGINVARNCGAWAAAGEWLLFCDADDEVDGDWLAAMHDAFVGRAAVVAGTLDYRRLNPPAVLAWRGAERVGVVRMHGYMRSGHGANFGVTRTLFREIGGFDESFRGGGDDIDFMWRAQLAGYPLRDVPAAIVHYRLRASLGDQWRQAVSYGASEVLLYAKFAHLGLRRRSASAVIGDVWWIASRLPFALPLGRRGAWLRRAGQQIGRARGAFRYRRLWW